MSAGEKLEPFRYGGNVVFTFLTGEFVMTIEGTSLCIAEMDQVIVSTNESVTLECTRGGALQIIWSPAFAQTQKGVVG